MIMFEPYGHEANKENDLVAIKNNTEKSFVNPMAIKSTYIKEIHYFWTVRPLKQWGRCVIFQPYGH